MWLLDTNVLSELRRHDRAHPKVPAAGQILIELFFRHDP